MFVQLSRFGKALQTHRRGYLLALTSPSTRKDPHHFLIFTLHGVQLVEKLKQAGLNASEAVEDRAVTLQEVASFVDDLEFHTQAIAFQFTQLSLKSP